MPPVVEASQGGGMPDMKLFELMDGSLMDADKMQVFASFCTDSGASDEMNELTKIQEELTSRCEGAPNAAGASAIAPGSPSADATPRRLCSKGCAT